MLKLITLDVTNTVLRVLGGVGQQYAAIASIYGVKVDPQEINKAFGANWKTHNLKYPNYGSETGMKSHIWWSELVKQCFIDCGFNENEVLTKLSTHLYLHFKTNKSWEVLPGTIDTLKTIKSKNLKLGIISNFDERLETILTSVGLLHHFEFVLASKQFGFAKPDPKIFSKALELGNVSANEALHVGDNLENDYIGPRDVGMDSVLVCKNMDKLPNSVDKQHVILNLSELVKFI